MQPGRLRPSSKLTLAVPISWRQSMNIGVGYAILLLFKTRDALPQVPNGT